jgi:hypothetical protein
MLSFVVPPHVGFHEDLKVGRLALFRTSFPVLLLPLRLRLRLRLLLRLQVSQ